MEEPDQESSSERTMPPAVDAALGAAAMGMSVAAAVTRRLAQAATPIGHVVMHPPLLSHRLHPARVVEALVDRGHEVRTSSSGDLNLVLAAVVPAVVDEVLDTLDLTALVLQRVDIDTLVLDVDFGAVIDRIDIPAIVADLDIDAIVREVDINAIVRQVDIDAIVSRVDIDAIVKRIDVDAIVDRVDIDAIVERVDIDAIAKRIDVDAIVDRVDINAIAKRIDLDAIMERVDINAIVSRVDVDAIVRRLDLVDLADEIVNGIDLPEIIRQSSGAMASDVVLDARMQSINADVASARLVDRIIRRRRARRTDAPGEPESLARVNLPEPTDVTQTQPLPPQPEPPEQELPR
jgi:hypothetical protein